MEIKTDLKMETRRLEELRRYKILDTITEDDYENITHMASIICDVPIALISFVDEHRQWFKSHRGIDISETAREHSFCAHALNPSLEALIVPDSRKDKRFESNPFVTGEPNIVFYAGIPLINENGYSLGTVCIVDNKPRELSNEQLQALKMLSSQVMKLLELRKSNLELMSTTQRLELALDAGRLGSYELDLKSGRMKTSAKCKQNFGIDEHDEFNFSRLLSLIVQDDLPDMQNAVNRAINEHIIYDATYRIKLPGDEIRWIHASGLPVYDEHGDAIQMTGVTINITKQKNFTTELEKQVMERTNELNRKNGELESMNKELQSFAYVSSHDLQEPLRKIQTFSSRIVAKDIDKLSDQAKEYFERIQSAAGRMQNLIDDLLDYSRATNAKRVYEYTDLTTIVETVKDDLKEEILQKHAFIECGDLCHVNVIPFQFRQLLQNLFSNSIKFSRANVPLRINVSSKIDAGRNLSHEALSPDLTYCHITVSDNGIGFEQQYSDKIFELFERLNSKYEYGGTGIGLAIVKRIVDNHNGFIIAKSAIDKGATFNIFLPSNKE